MFRMFTLSLFPAEVELKVCTLFLADIVPNCAPNLSNESFDFPGFSSPDLFRMTTGSALLALEGNSKSTSQTPIHAIAIAGPNPVRAVCEPSLCSSALGGRSKKPKTKYTRVSNGLRKRNVTSQRICVPHRRPNIG